MSLGSRSVLLLLVVALFALPAQVTLGMDLTVDTEIPEYILEDHIDLNGSLLTTVRSLTDDDYFDFADGESQTVSLENDGVVLKPTLDFRIQNGGEPVIEPGTGTDWDIDLLDCYVVHHQGTYFLYYTGSRGTSMMDAHHIGVATSTDGVRWTKYNGNPVVRSGDTYDLTSAIQPIVIVVDGKFHMYYGGNHGNRGTSDLQDIDICYATSDNGLDWKKYSGNPLIKNGPKDTDWDGLALRPGDIRWDGGRYVLYVKGVGATGGLGPKPKLGLFTSSDLVTWTEYSGNYLYGSSALSWEKERANFNTLDMHEGTYRIWTHIDDDFLIGWISSRDGLEWADSGAPMVGLKAGSIYSQGLRHPRSVTEGDDYLMYVMCYSGGEFTIGYFRVVPQDMTGTFTSRSLDAGGIVRMVNITWDDDVWNGSSISYAVRWSNDSLAWSGWEAVTDEVQPSGSTARYFQYRAQFSSDKHWLRPRLDRFSINYTSTRSTVEYSVDGGPWQPGTVNEQGLWNATVPLRDGDFNIMVRGVDSSAAEVIRTLPVRVDLRPPVGELQLEGGNNVTADAAIDWLLMASDTHGVPRMRMSTDPDMTDVPWTTFASRGVLGYTGPDGNVTVYAEIMDGAGRTAIVSDSILVDTTAPTGNLTINGGARATWDRTVTLDIAWEDALGLSHILVSNHAGFSTYRRSEPVHQLSWDLLDKEGVNIVYVRLVDLAGHEAVIWSSIILDMTPPFASFVIDGDREHTSDREVTLDIWEEEDLPVSAMFANGDLDFTGGWQEIVDGQTIPWTLTEGPDGPRTVRMLVRDDVGHEKVVVDTILLDTTPPSGELLFPECPEGYTGSQRVMVRISATDELSGVEAYRSRPGGEWEVFGPFINVTLPSVEGVHEIAVDLVDGAGNEATLLASIVLDMTAPTGHIVVANGSRYVNYISIPVELRFEDDGSGLSSFSNKLLVDAGEPWIDYTTEHVFAIPAGTGREGAWNIIYYVRDRAGNVGEANATVIVDLTAPGIELRHVGGDRIESGVNEFTVVVWDEFDPSPTVEWRVDGKGWRPLDGNGFEVDLDTGKHTFEVRAVDAAGNVAEESLREEVTLSLVVTSTALLLVIVIVAVAVLVYMRERKRMQDMEREL